MYKESNIPVNKPFNETSAMYTTHEVDYEPTPQSVRDATTMGIPIRPAYSNFEGQNRQMIEPIPVPTPPYADKIEEFLSFAWVELDDYNRNEFFALFKQRLKFYMDSTAAAIDEDATVAVESYRNQSKELELAYNESQEMIEERRKNLNTLAKIFFQ